jgi:L-lactate transport
MHPWPQPVDPLHHLALSALVAALPLALLLVVMGGLRRSGYVSAAWALLATVALALTIWGMPLKLALMSTFFGAAYALWPIMWIVLTALWLYNLSVETGSFELLRRWMAEHASGDLRIQAVLVAFCFGALLEGTAGFGTPVAVTAFLLVGLGFAASQAVTVALIANTAPVAFGALGIPIVALAGVTGLPQAQLSSMVGRQLPFLSLLIPAYLIWVVTGRKGLRGAWPAAAVGGGSFALAQFAVSNTWGPYAADIIASLGSIMALALLLRVWTPRVGYPPTFTGARAKAAESQLTWRQGFAAWAPWILLAGVMVVWSYLKLFQTGRLAIAVPWLDRAILITLYHKAYVAVYSFEPLAAGTAALVAVLLSALVLRAPARLLLSSGIKTIKQLLLPALTVVLIVALAYLYNYSGMAYTLGAALAALGGAFPLFSSFLGWVACFMSGSDTASNILFGNLQVAAAHQIGVSPVLLAATNSSGAVTGKMISPQNIAVGVTTVGLVGKEGDVLRTTFWHSILFAAGLSALAFAQAYWLKWMVP